MRNVVVPAAVCGVLLVGSSWAGAFQPPLTNIQAGAETNGFDLILRYEVFDAHRQATVPGSRRYGGDALDHSVLEGLVVADGIVAWRIGTAGLSPSADAEIGYAVYDPARGIWIRGHHSYDGTSLIYWETRDLRVSKGIVAWQAAMASQSGSWRDTAVGCAVYDAARGSWVVEERRYEGSSINYWATSGLAIGDRIVAWKATTAGSRHSWDTELRCAIYDAARGVWARHGLRYEGTSLNYWATTNLVVANGIVAWQADTRGTVSAFDTDIGYAIYDPSRPSWVQGTRLYDGRLNDPWSISGWAINNHTLLWTATDRSGSVHVSRGYDQKTGAWDRGPNTAWARFAASTVRGPPPLGVWFCDLSLGAANWRWNFGDGTTSPERNPFHWFERSGVYTVTLTASGPRGTNTYSRTITVEGAAEPLRFDSATTQVTNNQFRSLLTGLSPQKSVVLFASSNLADWQPLLTNPPAAGPFLFSDTLRTNRPARFYRAVQP